MPKKGTRVILKDGRSAVVQKNNTKSSILVGFLDGTTLTIARTDIAEEIRRICERCNSTEAIPGERFCKECRKARLQEMKESGYLQGVPFWGRFRSSGQQENTRETKNGVDEYRIMPEPTSDL